MAIKRTSDVPSVISSTDRRIKDLESSKNNLDPNIAAATVVVADDDNPELDLPGETSGVDKKYEFKRVLKGYIYGGNVTGFNSRCELYFSENPEIAKDDPVNVQGVHGTSTDNFGISPKNYKVFEVDQLPWTDGIRTTQSWRNTPTTGNNGETITNTVWFNPVVEVPSSYPRTSGRELITTRRIDSASVDGRTVTVTLNSAHLFEVGDIISVDLPDEIFGRDGLFEITAVPDNRTIVYELEIAAEEPATFDNFASPGAFVYPVARRFVKDGTVWIDRSVTPNKVWVWNKLRWYDTADPILDQVPGLDTVAPSPVDNLEVTSASQEVPTIGSPGRSSVTLSWDAPTTNEDGSPLEDLGGFSVRWRYSILQDWRIYEIDDPEITSWTEQNFVYNVPVFLAVYAKDKSGNRSAARTTSITTAAAPAPELKAPSKPEISEYLGTLKVFWNGLDADGNAAYITAFEVELHISRQPNFTADASTLFERFPAINGPTFTIIPGNAEIGGQDLVDGETLYFKFKFLDVWGFRTGQSEEQSFIAKRSNVVTFEMIDVGTIDGEILIGAEFRTKLQPSSTSNGGGLVMDSTGFTAYNATGAQVFNINFADGAVDITGGGPITIANYATSQTVNSLEQVVISANTLAFSASQTANIANIASINALQTATLTAQGLSVTNSVVSSVQTGLGEANTRINTVTQTASLTAAGLSVTNSVVSSVQTGLGEANTRINTVTQTANLTAQGLSVTNTSVTTLEGGLAGANTSIQTVQSNLSATNLIISAVSSTANNANSTVTAITTIGAGGAVFMKKGPIVGAINGTTNETTIDGGTITTGTITANLIEADAISAYLFAGREIRLSAFSDNRNPKISLNKDRIAAFNSANQPTFRILANGDIFADDVSIATARLTGSLTSSGTITGGSIVGSTYRTRASGSTDQRVILSGTTHRLAFYNTGDSDANPTGTVQGTSSGLTLNGSGNISFQNGGTQIAFVSSLGAGFSSTSSRWIGQLYATGLIRSDGNIRGDTITGDNLTGTGTRNVNSTSAGTLTNATSSRRYKQDIQDLSVDLQDILNMQPKTFRRIEEVQEYGEEAPTYAGFIAEDLSGTSLDPFVFYIPGEDGTLIPEGIHYGELTAALVLSIKDQNARLSELEARLAALEGGV
jgi:hypothetical protein